MSVPLNMIPNEQSRLVTYAGFESIRGTAVAPDFKLYGSLNFNTQKDLIEIDEYDGSYDGDIDPSYGPLTVSGTYAQQLTYEDAPALFELGVASGESGVSDSESTPGYVWTYEPNRFRDDLASVTMEHGFPGFPFTAEQVMVSDFTISADIDDSEAVWKYTSNLFATYDALKSTTSPGAATGGTTTTYVNSGASWTVNEFAGAFLELLTGTAGNIGEVREIASNTATTLTLVTPLPATVAASDTGVISGRFTAGISDRSRIKIAAPGTKLYLDAIGGTTGTTEFEGGFISFSINHNNMIQGKRFMRNTDRYSSKIGRDKRRISGQIRIEFDTRRQRDNWLAATPEMMRIEQIGPMIDSGAGTYHRITMDFDRIYWNTPTMDQRGSNLTLTIPFRAFLSDDTGSRAIYEVKNTLSAML